MVGALCAAAAILVVASGLAKLRAPLPTATMFVSLAPAVVRHSRVLRPAARAVGVVEIVVGVLFLAVGGRFPAVLLAACWLAFTGVAVRLATNGNKASCGCFGSAGAPVGPAHIGLNLAGLALTIAAAIAPVPAAGGVLDHSLPTALTGAVQVVLVAWLGYLTITALPALAEARRLAESA